MLLMVYRFSRRAVLLSLLPLAASCSLAGREVEPDLPTGRVSGGNTLVCRADGLPVVAHNDSSFGTVLISVLAFFGDPRPVASKLTAGNELRIRAYDSQNVPVAGQKAHALYLVAPGFRGVGTYALAAPESYYQETLQTNAVNNLPRPVTFNPAPSATPQLTVTEWNTTTRHLVGTFAFTATAPGTGQTVALTEGRFDVIVDQ